MSLTGHRGSRAFHSEKEAWERVRTLGKSVSNTNVGILIRLRNARTIVQIAEAMLAQLKLGVHENPPLTVFSLANPPRGGRRMSRRLYTIEYRHTNGKDYYHDFRSAAQLYAMPDGSLAIRAPGVKLWKDFPGE